MHDHPVTVLCDIVRREPGIASDPRRCRSMLNDHLRNGYRKEVNLLVYAIETGATRILAGGSAPSGATNVPVDHLVQRAVERFESETGLKPPESVWAVRSWASAMKMEVREEEDRSSFFARVYSAFGPKSKEGTSNKYTAKSVEQNQKPVVSLQTKAHKNAGESWLLKCSKFTIPLRRCPAGRFTMGSPESEPGRDSDENQVEVTLTEDFWIMETPVTQLIWSEVTNTTRVRFNSFGIRLWSERYGKGPEVPAYDVPWSWANEFAAYLTQHLQKIRKIPKGMRFALPTEAQWEYACRAGTSTTFNFGDDRNILADYAWFATNSQFRVHPAGQKRPNPWGLYDMHGNVWEWCADWYDDRLNGGVDPTGPEHGSRRVFRGGCRNNNANRCRSANRYWLVPSDGDDYGFRLVLIGSP